MNVLTGSSQTSWHPIMTTDTTTSSYWLNWRVVICALWIISSISVTVFLISRYEGPRNSRSRRVTQKGKTSGGVLYEDELWKPCLRGVHQVWLLVYRLIAFFVLLIMLSLNAAVDGGNIFFYYTQ